MISREMMIIINITPTPMGPIPISLKSKPRRLYWVAEDDDDVLSAYGDSPKSNNLSMLNWNWNILW